MGTSFTKLGLFFHKLFFIINIDFPPLHEIASNSSLKRRRSSRMLCLARRRSQSDVLTV